MLHPLHFCKRSRSFAPVFASCHKTLTILLLHSWAHVFPTMLITLFADNHFQSWWKCHSGFSFKLNSKWYRTTIFYGAQSMWTLFFHLPSESQWNCVIGMVTGRWPNVFIWYGIFFVATKFHYYLLQCAKNLMLYTRFQYAHLNFWAVESNIKRNQSSMGSNSVTLNATIWFHLDCWLFSANIFNIPIGKLHFINSIYNVKWLLFNFRNWKCIIFHWIFILHLIIWPKKISQL